MAQFGEEERRGPSRRLSVIQGHLNPAKSYSCSGGNAGAESGGAAKKKLQPSAPMSSTKDEVQRAFPRKRFVNSLSSQCMELTIAVCHILGSS